MRQIARTLMLTIAMSAPSAAIAQTSDVPANAAGLVDVLVRHRVFESFDVADHVVTLIAGSKIELFAPRPDWDRLCRWGIAKARMSAPAVNAGRIVHPAGLVLVQCSL